MNDAKMPSPSLIYIWIDRIAPLAGTAAVHDGDARPFEGWMELIQAVSHLLGAIDTPPLGRRGLDETPEAPRAPGSANEFHAWRPPVKSQTIYVLTYLAASMSLGHHIDHVIRGNAVGWPVTNDENTFTASLVIYPIIGVALLLYRARRIGSASRARFTPSPVYPVATQQPMQFAP
jgi:hypothetical protein